MKRCVASLAFVFVAAGVIAGCHCRRAAPSQSLNFEDDCIDPTCDFRATEGTVARASTLAAGEHGMEISAGGAAERAEVSPFEGSTVEFEVWCEQSGTLQVTITTEDADAGVRSEMQEVRVGSSWSHGFASLAVPDPRPTYVTDVLFRNTTAGRCLVDAVVIGESNGQCVSN